MHILVINPGSTSTKIALYNGNKPLFEKEISHSAAKLSQYENIVSQQKFREKLILQALAEFGYDLKNLTCIVARGGALKPLPGGTYLVNNRMLRDLKSAAYGEHASNLGAILADHIARKINVEAYIVDPITVSEMDEVATVSGIPELKRESIFHALNQKAIARMAAQSMGKRYRNSRLIVVHMGGGISVGVHKSGRVVDVNNALNGDGPLSPTRSGSVPEWSLVKLVLSGKFDESEFKKRIMTNGGMSAYLGTSDLREVEKRFKEGDKEAALIFQAMIYQIAKEVGACSTVLNGKIDAIVLTGGMARDKMLVNLLKKRISFIGKILVYPGSMEMRALALGALRVCRYNEDAKTY